MRATPESRLRELEAECAALCREHGWSSPEDTPNYRLVHSDPATFRLHAELMLLGIHPRGDSSLADVQPAQLPYRQPGYAALLDEAWVNTEPGARQTLAVALEIAGMFGGEARQVLRFAPAGNMIPFRTESILRLPDALRKQGLAVGARLVGIVRPRVLVLMGGDRVLFRMSVSELPGRVIDSAEETFGTTSRAYRDVVVAADDGASTLAAVIPLGALEDGLRALARRLTEQGLIPARVNASGR